MAARNVKSMPAFDPQDKMQSNTLKRQPSPDWSKNDLLRLLSYFEGELQARDIVIAALKAEKAKQLLYQAKYGRFGLGDPFMALQRDAVGTKDSNFDEAAVKAMYDNQLAQLENLIATQRKAQLKMREQLTNAEKRYHKVCSELEEEKRKHAQDTAQGDDVTYMLEKERERLRQEIDFEKNSSKKLEKDLRRTLAALEEERASAARHKQVALLLLKERKQILQRIASGYQRREQNMLKFLYDYKHRSLIEESEEKRLQLNVWQQRFIHFGSKMSMAETLLSEDQLHAEDVAEGLDAESRHSLAMEAALEQQLGEFESERAALTEGLNQEQTRTRELEAQVEALQKQVQILAGRTSLESIEIKSSVSPQASTAHSSTPPTSLVHSSGMSTGLGPVAYSPTSSPTGVRAGSGMGAIGSSLAPGPSRSAVSMVGGGTSTPLVWQVHKVNKVLEGGRIGSSSPEREVIYRPLDSPSTRKIQYGGGAAGGYSSPSLDRQGTGPLSGSPRGEARVMTVGSSGPESAPVLVGGGCLSSPGARVNITPGNSATVVTQGGGKISFHVSPGSGGSSIISAGAGGVGGGGGGAGSPRRTPIAVAASAGRGMPPPVPPNKPNIVSISPGSVTKPSPPPKVGLMGRGGTESSGLHSKTVQIPVSVVASASSVSSSPSSSSQSPRESSPIRKTAQPSHSFELDTPAVSPNIMQANPATSLEFLGPEMASLQAMLASLSTGETSTCDTPSVELPPPSAPVPLSDPQNSSTVISHNSMLSSFPLGINNSIVHKLTASGDVNTLRFLVLENDADVNMPLKDGSTLIHTAVENNQGDCLQLLLDSNGNSSAAREDHVTPLHIAAAKGHIRCLELLLEKGVTVNTVTQAGDAPLHLAVRRGDLHSCKLLLDYGADICLPNAAGMTPLHSSVISDQPDILELLLKQLTTDESVRRSLLLASEKEGRSLIHLAASLSTEKCLSLLLECASLNLDITDLHGHSVYQAASKVCKDFLDLHDQERGRQVTLLVELKTQLEGATVSCTRIGTIEITPSTSWSHLEIQLQTTLADFLSKLDRGLRTRRLARMETESSGDDGSIFTLGLSMQHIKYFEMGFYRWSPCMQTEKQPFSIASNNNDKKAAIIIDDTNNLCELIAFDILHPVPILHSYLRLLSQYKSAVFYGPVHSGKSYLVQRLAQCLATEEKGLGRKPAIFKMSLTSRTSHDDLLAFLKQKGCLLPVEQQTPMSPILLLEDLEFVSMATFFGELLDPLLQRGMQHAFSLTEDSKTGQLYYFPESFYLLGTLNRTRSTGIDLSIQQRFRWVQFRHDAEPLRNLLARHFLRRLYHLGDGKLPAFDDPLLQATEWIICVWQRLNDSLGKLGLPNVALGPCCFFKCPVEKRNPKVILQWVQDLWNSEVAPQVREAVKKGAGSETQGQQKVANTALYVLMQRSIVLGCPLSGAEKEAYLQGFIGSNELDLPFRGDKINKRTTAVQLGGRRVRHNNCNAAAPEGSSSPPLQMESQQNVEGSSSVVTSLSQNGTDRQECATPFEFFTGTNIKHRSLSESSVNKTLELLDELERQQQGKHSQLQQTKQQILQNADSFTTSFHQAKVPKLEMRSSRILSLSNSFKTLSRNGSSDDIGSCDEQGQAVKVNPLYIPVRPGAGQHLHHHHNKHHAHKKSRSSENISPSGLFAGGMHQSVNPFSFSLSTPKSSLTSFKFFDKPSPLLSSQASLSSPEASSSSSSTASAMSLLQSLAPALSSASPSALTYEAGSPFGINSENQSHTSPVIGTQSEFSDIMSASQVRSRQSSDVVIEGCTGGVTES